MRPATARGPVRRIRHRECRRRAVARQADGIRPTPRCSARSAFRCAKGRSYRHPGPAGIGTAPDLRFGEATKFSRSSCSMRQGLYAPTVRSGGDDGDRRRGRRDSRTRPSRWPTLRRRVRRSRLYRRAWRRFRLLFRAQVRRTQPLTSMRAPGKRCSAVARATSRSLELTLWRGIRRTTVLRSRDLQQGHLHSRAGRGHRRGRSVAARISRGLRGP